MYISKKNRELIRQKFGGRCAYSGTVLKDDWEVDHIKPLVRNWWNNTVVFEKAHNIDNMIPAQRIINRYKSSMHLEDFRERMLTLHLRLRKIPKNPKTERSKKHKKYLLEIAELFGITSENPFSGKFYFETLKFKQMIQIKKLAYETYSVNGKIVTVDSGRVVNDYDLTSEEMKALKSYRKNLKREDELAKNALIEIAKIIIETENKINSSIDDDFCKLLNNISDEFDVGVGAELLKEVENSIIFTNSLGEIFFEGDKCYHKCRRETTYHQLNEIVTYNAKKGYCEKDAFFSEIFKKKIECEIYGL